MSSILSCQLPLCDLLIRKLATAVSKEPKCRGPEGLGANLPEYSACDKGLEAGKG